MGGCDGLVGWRRVHSAGQWQCELNPTPVQFEPWRNTLTNQHDWASPVCSLSPGEILLPTSMRTAPPLCSLCPGKILLPTSVRGSPPLCSLSPGEILLPTSMRGAPPLCSWSPARNALYQPMMVLAITVFDELTCNSCNKYASPIPATWDSILGMKLVLFLVFLKHFCMISVST